jgi:hypothetical protein
MLRVLLLTVVCATTLVLPATSAEPVLSRYRDVTLGDAVQVVVERLQMTLSDVKVVSERPTLVQQLTWRTRRFVSGTDRDPDPVADMVLTFHLGRLARIAVTYDRERTAGLTNADLHEAMSNVYGTSLLLSTPIQSTFTPPADPEVIGRWEDAGTLVLLWRGHYPTRVGLTIASMGADREVQVAIAEGLRMDASGAPARDLARRAAEVAALRARDEKTRLDNKAVFKP